MRIPFVACIRILQMIGEFNQPIGDAWNLERVSVLKIFKQRV